MTDTMKRAWTKPELIVLVRNKPEERVLGTCKGVGGGPGTDTSDCSLRIDDCASLHGS